MKKKIVCGGYSDDAALLNNLLVDYNELHGINPYELIKRIVKGEIFQDDLLNSIKVTESDECFYLTWKD